MYRRFDHHITQRYPTCLGLVGLEIYSYADPVLFRKLEFSRARRTVRGHICLRVTTLVSSKYWRESIE